MNKLAWLVFIVLVACVLGLVVIDMARSGTSYHFDNKNDSKALECMQNCENLNAIINRL